MSVFASVVEGAGLPRPLTEHPFHPRRKWRFDFAWPDRLLALEVDGGLHTGGRHVRGRGREDDLEKLAEALCLGWRVLVVSTDQLNDGRALTWLERLLRE